MLEMYHVCCALVIFPGTRVYNRKQEKADGILAMTFQGIFLSLCMWLCIYRLRSLKRPLEFKRLQKIGLEQRQSLKETFFFGHCQNSLSSILRTVTSMKSKLDKIKPAEWNILSGSKQNLTLSFNSK